MRGRGFLTLGLAGLVALFVAGRFAGEPVMPSYLGVWLFWLAAPVGALPLVLLHDLGDRRDTPLPAALRALLTLMPFAALLGVPVLLDLQGVAAARPGAGFAAAWAAPSAVLWRSVAILLVWVALALVFGRPSSQGTISPRRRALAILGLVLHLVLGSLAAFDWVGALEPGLNASGLGLLLLLAQSGIALSLAWLGAAARGEADGTQAARLMLLLLGAWVFMQFTQYLVVWSANLPEEVVWYLHRDGGFGRSAELVACAVVALAVALLLGFHGRRVVTTVAVAILVLHLVEMLWLVLPASRGALDFTLTDFLAVIGLGALLLGAVPLALRSGHTSGGLDRGRA